ncbi:MAG TPA: hypothetical protein QF353_00965 [Gammaproteobacteria bacterium]|nr:hypothetical protein [Gammaproteobacteria bacterium]
MPEKKVHDYIYVNGDQLYVMMPVIGGDTIGLDNTCKTGFELKDYFYNQKALKSVRAYTKILHENLDLLSLFEEQEEQVTRINSQLEDLKHYEEILVNFSKNKSDWVARFSGQYPEIPAEIQQVVKQGKNLSSILLAPNGIDDYVRLNDYTFSLKRGREEVFAKALREGVFTGVNITIKGVEEVFRESSLSGVDDSKEKGSAKVRINTLMDNMQRWIGDEHKVSQLIYNQIPGEGEKSTDNLIDYIQAIEASESLDDLTNAELFRNLNLLMEIDVSQLQSRDEQNIFVKEYVSTGGDYNNSNMKGVPAERLSIMLQLLLATVNIYQVSNENTTKNFGEVLDSDQELSHALIGVIKSLIEVGEKDSVERGVLAWVNDKKEAFGLSKVMNEEDMQRIITDFKANYTVAKGSEHFDEFLIRNNQEGGKWVSYQNRMAIDLGYAVAKGFAIDGLCADKKWLDNKVSAYEGLVHKEGHELKPYHHSIELEEQQVMDYIQKIDTKDLIKFLNGFMKKGLLTEKLTEVVLDKIDQLDNSDEMMTEFIDKCIENKLVQSLKMAAKKNQKIIYQKLKRVITSKHRQVVLILIEIAPEVLDVRLLINACKQNMPEVAMKLLDQPEVRANAHADDNYALRFACENGMTEVALKLLEQPKVREKAHVDDNFALRWACLKGMSDVALELLKLKGVQENAHSQDNWALRMACRWDMKEVALKLLESPEVRSNAHTIGNNALRFACENGMTKVALKLLEQPKVREKAHVDDNLALRWACQEGMKDVVLELLKLDKVRENANAGNNKALRYACLKGMSDVALELLKLKGVQENAHARDNYALRNACEKGMPKVVVTLLNQSKVLKNADKILKKLKRENESFGPSDILHAAIVSGNTFLVDKFLKIDAMREDFGKIIQREKGDWVDKNAIIIYACKHKMWNCVNVFAEIDAYKKTIGQLDNMALKHAYQHKNFKIMSKLLGLRPARGWFVRITSASLLTQALEEDNIAAVMILLKIYKPEDVNLALKMKIAEKLMESKPDKKQVLLAYQKLLGIFTPQDFQSMKAASRAKIMDFVSQSSNSILRKEVREKTLLEKKTLAKIKTMPVRRRSSSERTTNIKKNRRP